MTFQAPLTAIAIAALFATGPLAQQRPSTSSPQTVMSLIGCVERVAPTPSARGTAQPTPEVPAYKLIDVQPGAGTTTTLKADSQFLLAVSNTLTTPINLGKFQNQRVEVTGTIAPAPPAKVNPQSPARPAVETTPLPTFTASSLKVVSTECK